jgi:N-acetylated-alpha-linked acidic dipeptidase
MESHFIDPGWKYHVAIAKVVGLAAMRLADADVVPLHYTGYAGEVGRYLNQMTAQQDRVFGHEVVHLARDKVAAAQWREAARGAQSRINNELRQGAGTGHLNELTIQLEKVERALLVSRGLPGRHWFKHQIYAPGVNSGYGTQVLPGINDALFLHNNRALARSYVRSLSHSLLRATHALNS